MTQKPAGQCLTFCADWPIYLSLLWPAGFTNSRKKQPSSSTLSSLVYYLLSYGSGCFKIFSNCTDYWHHLISDILFTLKNWKELLLLQKLPEYSSRPACVLYFFTKDMQSQYVMHCLREQESAFIVKVLSWSLDVGNIVITWNFL